MKKLNIILASLAVMGIMSSCEDNLNVQNPNNQTTSDFGFTSSDLNEAVIACYNHIRMEGSSARVGYTLDVVRGDEAWNSSQIWYKPFADLNAPATDEIGCLWPWREWYYTINVCNYVVKQVELANLSKQDYNEIKGQALFLRAFSYYYLISYYQNVPLITDYDSYSTLDGLYASNNTQDEVLDQMEKDLSEAMGILPSREIGGEWAKGRATSGAAAGYLARTLMFRQKYSEALPVLKDIIKGEYGSYDLVADFGDNFRSGASENNIESLFEIQYLDYGSQGTDDEWTPVNTSSNATQGHAVESNFAPAIYGGWADISASPWLYNLFKAEKCTDGTLDPRLYWTLATYEAEYEDYNGKTTAAYPSGNDPRCNIAWMNKIPAEGIVTNSNNGGIVICKHTSARENMYASVVTGLHCGVNLRVLRFSDILLRAAECENEVNGPTTQAFEWIDRVRQRSGLAKLDQSKFNSADKLFEQIANVERPKEFGCEHGRGIDLLRWGFFYSDERVKQMTEHNAYRKAGSLVTDIVTLDDVNSGGDFGSSTTNWRPGHEYFPIYQGTLNANPNLVGNSANTDTDNSAAFLAKYKVRPIPAD